MKPQIVPKCNQAENQYKRTEPYHIQLHAKRADSKVKKMIRKTDDTLTISTVPYPLQHQTKEKSVQSRHPLQDSAQINLYRPGTPHNGLTHRKYMTRPAREILTDPAHPK